MEKLEPESPLLEIDPDDVAPAYEETEAVEEQKVEEEEKTPVSEEKTYSTGMVPSKVVMSLRDPNTVVKNKDKKAVASMEQLGFA